MPLLRCVVCVVYIERDCRRDVAARPFRLAPKKRISVVQKGACVCSVEEEEEESRQVSSNFLLEKQAGR